MRKRELLEIPTIEFTPITLLFTGGSNKCTGTGTGTGTNTGGTAINLSTYQGGDDMPTEDTDTP